MKKQDTYFTECIFIIIDMRNYSKVSHDQNDVVMCRGGNSCGLRIMTKRTLDNKYLTENVYVEILENYENFYDNLLFPVHLTVIWLVM